MTKITQSMTAQGLNEELAGLFHEDPGFPVFFFQRLVFSHDHPITYVEYTMRGDMAFQDTFQPQLDSTDYGRPGK
jgi:DNA-binding GntR family transcriptional regulator